MKDMLAYQNTFRKRSVDPDDDKPGGDDPDDGGKDGTNSSSGT